MIDIEVEVRDSIAVAAAPEEAFALVADVGRSGAHFPGVDRLEPIDGSGRWRWSMREKGVGPLSLRVKYDAIYESDPQARTVRWRPPPGGGGDMDSSGSWEVVPRAGGGSVLRFHARTVAHVPVPRLMQRMAEVLAREELSNLKREYLQAIRRTLGPS